MKMLYQEDQTIVVQTSKEYAFAVNTIYFFLAVLSVILGIFLPDTDHHFIRYALLIAGAGFLIAGLFSYYRIRSTQYTINLEQIMIETGILMRKTIYVELYRVKDYVEERPFWYRALSLINLRLMTIDREMSSIQMTGIPDSNITSIIRNRVQIARQKNRVYEVEQGK